MSGKYEIVDDHVIYADENHGAFLNDDEKWYPFCWFLDGDMDIGDDGFDKPSLAFKAAQQRYT